jgi:hypothetical protein
VCELEIKLIKEMSTAANIMHQRKHM